jgi:hypothetical protein
MIDSLHHRIPDLNIEEIRAQARFEIYQERKRVAIEKEKHRLRAIKWWHRFIPIITITWRKS